MGIFSAIAGWFKVSPSSTEEEVTCACGGQCTCKDESESAIAAVQAPPRPTPVPPTPPAPPAPPPEPIDDSSAVQATFPEIDELPITVRKIEDASTLPPISPKNLNQPTLPGFEDTIDSPPVTKKRSNSRKPNAKLPRKSTVRRKK